MKRCDIMTTGSIETKEIVQSAATSARILTYVKENRVEMIGLLILAHLLGLSDRLWAQASGVCF